VELHGRGHYEVRADHELSGIRIDAAAGCRTTAPGAIGSGVAASTKNRQTVASRDRRASGTEDRGASIFYR
jgi:hypothetical protein